MQAHPYRISVAKLENNTEQHLMTFDVKNHDEIEKVLAHLQKKLPVSSAEQQAFAVGLKLFTEVILQHRHEAPFQQWFGDMGQLMRSIKRLPDLPMAENGVDAA